MDKSESRLKAYATSYLKKCEQLRQFINIANDFEIELSGVQKNIVLDKIQNYQKKSDTFNYFREWKYDHNCAGSLSHYHIGSSIEIEDKIRLQRLRELKLQNILDNSEE